MNSAEERLKSSEAVILSQRHKSTNTNILEDNIFYSIVEKLIIQELFYVDSDFLSNTISNSDNLFISAAGSLKQIDDL